MVPTTQAPEGVLLNEKGQLLDDQATQRDHVRFREDKQWQPVIIKRIDQSRRHPDDTLRCAIEEGLEQIERPPHRLALSALAAGMVVSFSAMAVGVIANILIPFGNPLITRLGVALIYPFGFIICIMSSLQLFTEHTALAVYPVLDRKAGWRRLLRLWAIVLSGNLIGAFLGALLLSGVQSVLDAEHGMQHVACHMLEYTADETLTSAVLAGWIMALTGWMILSTPPSASDVIFIYVGTFLIGIGGFHHSIVGSAEIFTALLMGIELPIGQIITYIPLIALGNLIGGSVFVALLNYAQIRHPVRNTNRPS